MSNSLFDQLKKTGLVDKTKAQKVKRDQYKIKKQKSKKGSLEELDEVKLLAEKTKAEAVERDRQINKEKVAEAESKAVTAQIIQLIESNRVADRDGEISYNFTDANVIKHIFVSEHCHKYLTSGKLCIAKLGEGYELVPKPVADKIKQRDAECIINNDDSIRIDQSQDEDDPYADYKIPDDLIW
jgi:uncharacterized protein